MSKAFTTAVEDLSREPNVASPGMSASRDEKKAQSLDQALIALRDMPDSPASTRLLQQAVADPGILERFTDPGFLTGPEAIALAARMQAIDPGTDVRFLRLLLPKNGPALDSWRATRVLEIVAAISDGRRTQTLLAVLLRNPDARVRSKAALLLGRANHNVGWLERGTDEPDPRIRANAVEALWGVDTREARTSFLAAAEDANHRVAANGVVGLYRAGDLRSAPLAEAMATHADPLFRAAAVWAMGGTQDPRFLPTLAKFMAENTGSVRRNALRATVQIRKRMAELKSGTPLDVTVAYRDGNFEVQVHSSDGPVNGLRPTSFVVMDGAQCLEITSVRKKAHPGKSAAGSTADLASSFYEITLALPPPAAVRVCVYCGFGSGEGEGTASVD